MRFDYSNYCSPKALPTSKLNFAKSPSCLNNIIKGYTSDLEKWLTQLGGDKETVNTVNMAITKCVKQISENNPRLGPKRAEGLQILSQVFKQLLNDSNILDKKTFTDLKLLCTSLKTGSEGEQISDLISIVEATLDATYLFTSSDCSKGENDSHDQIKNIIFRRLNSKVQYVGKITLDKIINELFNDIFASCVGVHLTCTPEDYIVKDLYNDIKHENASILRKILTLTVIGSIFGVLIFINPVNWFIGIMDNIKHDSDIDSAHCRLRDRFLNASAMYGG